jgi:HPt (histidine-containing phosphotransfer) domain-containing protein
MLPVFDHEGSFHRMGNDRQLFDEMAGFVQDDAPVRLQEIRHGLAESNFSCVKLAVHSLKGLISNFGATRAVSAAIKLESLLQQSRPMDELEAAFQELQAAVEELQHALATFCSKTSASL